MKKILLHGAVLSALAISASAHAATVGLTGTLTFQGEVTTDTCILEVGGQDSTTNKNMTIQMGGVPIAALGPENDPGAGGPLGLVQRDFDLKIKCAAGTTYTLALTPKVASGRGLGLESVANSASGVQVMLFDVTSGNYLNFAAPVAIPLTPVNGLASRPMRAVYSLKASTQPANVQAGIANAVANYTISYD